jgi:hypothetical protein
MGAYAPGFNPPRDTVIQMKTELHVQDEKPATGNPNATVGVLTQAMIEDPTLGVLEDILKQPLPKQKAFPEASAMSADSDDGPQSVHREVRKMQKSHGFQWTMTLSPSFDYKKVYNRGFISDDPSLPYSNLCRLQLEHEPNGDCDCSETDPKRGIKEEADCEKSEENGTSDDDLHLPTYQSTCQSSPGSEDCVVVGGERE